MRVLKPFSTFHHWLFTTGDAHTLALLRIVFCAITFLVFLVQSLYLQEYHGNSGLLTPEALSAWYGNTERISPLRVLPFYGVVGLYCILLLTALTGCIGLWTRISTWMLFVLVVLFQKNNPLILNSGDILLRLVLFYLALSQCGKVWSVDSYLLTKWRAPSSTSVVPLWPQRLIQLQIALLYFSTTWHKMQGALWREGTVTWYVSRLEGLARFPVPDILMTETAAYILTYGTLAVELALCTLVWFRPYRNWVLFAGLCLHAGIEYQMNIPFFGIITVSCYLSFFKGEEILRAYQWLCGLKNNCHYKPSSHSSSQDALS